MPPMTRYGRMDMRRVEHFSGSSTTIPDSSPNSHHATRNGGESPKPVKWANRLFLQVDGTDDDFRNLGYK